MTDALCMAVRPLVAGSRSLDPGRSVWWDGQPPPGQSPDSALWEYALTRDNNCSRHVFHAAPNGQSLLGSKPMKARIHVKRMGSINPATRRRTRMLGPALLVLLLASVLLNLRLITYPTIPAYRVQLGPISEWVSGLATLAAVIVALREASSARRKARLDNLCSIGGWMEIRRLRDGAPRWEITLLNSTDFPIYRWLAVPAGASEAWHLCSSSYGSLVPGTSQFELPGYAGSQQADSLPVKISFEDREGGFWTREPAGRLINIDRSVLDDHFSGCDATKGQ